MNNKLIRDFSKFLMLAMILLASAACSPSLNLDEPPDIRYGEDVCDECNMIINEERFAASYVTPSGDVRRFDDIGDMLVYIQRNNEEVHIYWVHDLNSGDWVDATEASYTVSPDLITPMGWGLASFDSKTAAEAFAADHEGRVTTWLDLVDAVQSGALDPTTLAGHFHNLEMDHGESDHDQN